MNVRILDLHIDRFGGLSNLTLAPQPGFNLIIGQNEDGKSTIMAFIRALFYGLSGGSHSILENDRKRLMPWGETNMSGWMVFEFAGKRYRIERSFGPARRYDRSVLRDDTTALSLELPARQEIGDFLFGVSEREFVNTVFISQHASADVEPDGGTLAKLTNLATTGDERVSCDEVESRIRKSMVRLKAEKGNGGLLNSLLTQHNQLTLERQMVLEKEQERIDMIQHLHHLTSASKQTSENLIRARVLLKDSQDWQALHLSDRIARLDLEQDLLKARQLMVQLRELTGEQTEIRAILTQAEEKRKQSALELEEFRTQMGYEYQQLAEEIDARTAAYETQKQELANSKTNPETAVHLRRSVLVGVVCGILILFLGVTGGRFVGPLAYSLIPVGLMISFYFGMRAKKIDQTNKLFQSVEQAALTSLLSASNQAFAENKMRQKTMQMRLEQQEKKLLDQLTASQRALELARAREDQKKVDRDRILLNISQDPIWGHYPDVVRQSDPNQPLSDLLSLADQLHQLTLAVQDQLETVGDTLSHELGKVPGDLLQDMHAFLSANTPEAYKPSVTGTSDISAMSERLSIIIESIRTILQEQGSEIIRLESDMRIRFISLRNLEDINDDLLKIAEQIRQIQSDLEALNLARTTLGEAFHNLQQNFGQQLNQRSGKILDALTCSRYQQMRVDRSFNIHIVEPVTGVLREWEYLSGGTIDQVYLALRLAVAELIGNCADRLPLCLDDIFVQYDDARAQAGLTFLQQYAEEQNIQVLLFTCHERLTQLPNVNLHRI